LLGTVTVTTRQINTPTTTTGDARNLNDGQQPPRRHPERRSTVGASVYREPVDTNAVLFQLGDPDETAGYIPDRDGAWHRVQEILAAHHLAPDQLADPGDLPPGVVAELAPHLRELNTPPTPALSTPIDLPRLTDLLAGTSLLAIDPDQATIFVHRWTATELEQRCHDQGRRDELHQAHQRAAQYWQWRLTAWPQDPHADMHDRLEARHHLLAAGEIDQATTLTESICMQLEEWGAWDHETTLSHDTLARLPPDSPRRPAWMGQLGNLAYRRGDYEDAERRYQQSLQIEERLGDQSGMATNYHHLGILAQARGDYEEAERRYQQSLQIEERLGNQSGMAASYGQLGNLAYVRGDYEEAERRYQQSLPINERLGDQSGMATNYHHLGMLAQARGDYEEAERRYQQSLPIFERLGDQSRMAASYGQLGMLAQARGDYEEAERRYQQSLPIFERLGNQSGMATSWTQLGVLTAAMQRYAEAIVWHTRALLMRERLQVPQIVIDARALIRLRAQLGNETFAGAAKNVLDDVELADLQTQLDSFQAASSHSELENK